MQEMWSEAPEDIHGTLGGTRRGKKSTAASGKEL